MENAHQELDPLIIAAETGRRILEAGGETYRAEDAIVRLCKAWGYTDVEAFATPTGIMASIVDRDNRSRAVVRRITRRVVDLHRISRLDMLVSITEQEGLSVNAAEARLIEIDREKPYATLITLLAAALSASLFTLLFHGSLRDAIGAFIVGLGIKTFAYMLQRWHFPDFITTIIGGAIAALLSIITLRICIVEHMDKTIIGSIMLLVPGLATVNAIRDTIAGDLVAGIARLTDAFITAAALAIGAGTVFSLLR
ncbi:threonine/serine exporter family protein [Gracilinema caldarium]|uniref:Threonine/serine exporter-like N-terminal domain-containing protein n=1 Tax=Gracilinema caldarium (strain ATCC 51460 / DSM 7334 / H1) TaxID=744872 RepID=F8F1M3_GRAC1|nr:threonine/serine exporter family protein [Gracilinema caldarium]AEJ19357.1 protein of unknown function DUF1212 [Gracilinema caldarium DSM 7334]